jgi:hypothetical protein
LRGGGMINRSLFLLQNVRERGVKIVDVVIDMHGNFMHVNTNDAFRMP